MYTITETKTVPNYETIMYRVKIAVDTAEDIPDPLDEWAVGSEMEVYENGGSRYKLGTDREWYPVNFKKGSGGGDNSEVVEQVNQNTSSISLLTGRVSRIETNIGGHTVKSDVPENAVFTDTVYDDSEVREDIEQNKADISLLKENVEFTPRIIGVYNIPWFIEGQGSMELRLMQFQKNIFALNFNGGGSPFSPEVTDVFMSVNIPIKRYEPSDYTQPILAPVILRLTNGNIAMGAAGYDDKSLCFVLPLDISFSSISLGNIIVYGELIEDETTT